MTDPVTRRFVNELRAGGVGGAGCDEGVVADVERGLGVRLPGAYRAFLLVAGGGWGPLEGSRYAVGDDLVGMQGAGRGIARRAEMELAGDAFVFLVHQGFACRFFLLEDGDDPAVYECVEGVGRVVRIAARFTEWVRGDFSRSMESGEGR